MVKVQQLIGLPVYAMGTGKRVGKITDVWLDEHWQLTGLIIGSSGLFASEVKTVAWNEVQTCGEDAVFIASESSVHKIKATAILRSFLTGVVRLRDMPVVTVQGLQLGRVSDVYFYPLQGTKIIGYELTDGFVSDLMEGRRWLRVQPESDTVLLGEDAIIVPAVSEAELEPVAASNSEDREKC
ncbi:PRC-barrel domain-containing protein [Paenibacillus protaetiae]|uniref:Photosystem reaction center subunit H n=1 Tax=Paenibacillus protaetiae TaxID=2509456 RepID=A0A4P6EQT2_9BACL|nr:PRC-barrel domain-containing protein [Paenibacillus protaetiae]QAY65202.1 photosystem reaction center subunit H [Paenibacillus protaetiae]